MEKYFSDRSQKNYKEFVKPKNDLFDKINEIDIEDGRKWILNNIK